MHTLISRSTTISHLSAVFEFFFFKLYISWVYFGAFLGTGEGQKSLYQDIGGILQRSYTVHMHRLIVVLPSGRIYSIFLLQKSFNYHLYHHCLTTIIIMMQLMMIIMIVKMMVLIVFILFKLLL